MVNNMLWSHRELYQLREPTCKHCENGSGVAELVNVEP